MGTRATIDVYDEVENKEYAIVNTETEKEVERFETLSDAHDKRDKLREDDYVDADNFCVDEISVVEEERFICRIYSQYDGYPAVRGLELANFIDNAKIVNGLSGGHDEDTIVCNGAGEFGAKLVEYFKEDYPSGNIYLHPEGDAGMISHSYKVVVNTMDPKVSYCEFDGEEFGPEEFVERMRELA